MTWKTFKEKKPPLDKKILLCGFHKEQEIWWIGLSEWLIKDQKWDEWTDKNAPDPTHWSTIPKPPELEKQQAGE